MQRKFVCLGVQVLAALQHNSNVSYEPIHIKDMATVPMQSPASTVASVMFVAEISNIFGSDRNYTVITYQYTVQNVVTDHKLRLWQTSKPDNLYCCLTAHTSVDLMLMRKPWQAKAYKRK